MSFKQKDLSILEQHRLDVTLSSVGEIGSIEGYDAYVIGSGAYAGHWISAASDFIRRNRAQLAARPVSDGST